MVSTSARNAGDLWFESRSWYDRFLYVNIHLLILMPVSYNTPNLLKIYIYIYIYMILGWNICWSLYIFNIIYYFQASVSIRSRYSLYIDDCVSTTKPNNPIRRVMQRNQA